MYRRQGAAEKINLQGDGGNAKPYQVKQVRRVILKYRLGRYKWGLYRIVDMIVSVTRGVRSLFCVTRTCMQPSPPVQLDRTARAPRTGTSDDVEHCQVVYRVPGLIRHDNAHAHAGTTGRLYPDVQVATGPASPSASAPLPAQRPASRCAGSSFA